MQKLASVLLKSTYQFFLVLLFMLGCLIVFFIGFNSIGLITSNILMQIIFGLFSIIFFIVFIVNYFFIG